MLMLQYFTAAEPLLNGKVWPQHAMKQERQLVLVMYPGGSSFPRISDY